MKPLSERDENLMLTPIALSRASLVGMKPLSERDENKKIKPPMVAGRITRRNEATL